MLASPTIMTPDRWRAASHRPRGADRRHRACPDCGASAARIVAQGRRPAERRRELDDLLYDDTPVPGPARVLAAARVFSEGNGYLAGQLVDRSA